MGKSKTHAFQKTEHVFNTFSTILKEFDNIIKRGGSINAEITDIKRYFTEYLLVVFYSEMEIKIQEEIEREYKRIGNTSISEFLNNTSDLDCVYKGIKKEFIASREERLRKKKNKSKRNFPNILSILSDADSRYLPLYESFILGRHAAAHKKPQAQEESILMVNNYHTQEDEAILTQTHVSWGNINGINDYGDKIAENIVEIAKKVTDALIEQYITSDRKI